MKTDCKTSYGITVGLIDSLIAIARVLAPRLHKLERRTSGEGWIPIVALEALKDLHEDADIQYIMQTPFNKNWLSDQDRKNIDLINKAAEHLKLTQKSIIV